MFNTGFSFVQKKFCCWIENNFHVVVGLFITQNFMLSKGCFAPAKISDVYEHTINKLRPQDTNT